MKKVFKIAGISLLVLLLLLLVLPFVFRGKILEIAKREVNNMLYAKVDFDRLGLSFIRSFPSASVSLENFYVVGTDEFEGDTLFFAENISATVNIKSFFGDAGYEISRISVNNAKLHAIVNANGNANWDIMKVDSSQTVTADEPSDFKLLLQKVTVRNSDILYDDSEASMNVALRNLNLTLSGDMTADETRIKTNLTADELNFVMDKISYLSRAKLSANVNIDADLKNMKFTLSDNQIQLNEIQASIDGWVAMPEDDSVDMDIQLKAPQTQFKDILSMIPAIYAKDFQDIRTSGNVTLEASAKGTMKDDVMPAFNLLLKIDNAMFQYPALPKAITNINTNMRIHSAGGVLDNTVIDIPAFSFDIGGNPFNMSLHVSTPVSDPNLALSAAGHLNLGMIKEVYPLEDMELSGILDADLKLATRMSYIEKEQFERVNASGILNIKNMDVKSKDMDDVLISNANLSFSPQFVGLSEFAAKIGENDIAANGRLENFIPYFMTDAALKGNLTVTSNYLNLNDFMAENPEETESSIGIIEIPKNIDFNLNGNFQRVIFDNLDMTDVVGQIIVRDGKVDMRNLSLNALGGGLTVNGYYDTGKNPQQPDVSLSLNIKEASFAQTFSTFVTIQKLAPVFENLLGNFSTHFTMTAPLGSDFMPILTSLTANGLLQSNNVEVGNLPVLNGLASALNNDALRGMNIRDLNLPFAINGGRVTTRPFDVRFGSGVMNLSGSTGLDQTIDYIAKIDLTDRLSNNLLRNVNVKIGGTFTNPTFHVDMRDALGQALGNAVGSILGNETGASLTEQATEQIERQAAAIRQQAKNAGDRLVTEAERQGQNLIDEANKTSNALTRIAAVRTAEAAANRLKEEAQRQANRLNEEAEKQVQELGDRARNSLNQ
jgi:hypothetical protein